MIAAGITTYGVLALAGAALIKHLFFAQRGSPAAYLRIVGPVVTGDTMGRSIVRGLTRSLDQWLRWGERARQRPSLRELPNYLLRDIGLSRCDANLEARKPFWRA
jgi:uncharacterized protein YjiS (DUF1127 family)